MPSEPTIEPLENNDYRLRQIFEGYVFHIPNYQRFYSWTESHCDDLWNDLLNVVEEGRNHYMGTVICKDENKPVQTTEFEDNYREYAIVDGQQRFTSLVLLTKALLSAYEDVNQTELSDGARDRYERIPSQDAKRLFVKDSKIDAGNSEYDIQNKLRLQDDDHGTFKHILREESTPEPDTPSQRRLIEAYEFYVDEIEELEEKHTPDEYLDILGQLISKIQSLQFMLYTIETQSEATLIFQSINDRGKGLSNLDKTKSFLMHKVYLNESTDGDSVEISINDVQRRFGQIYKHMQTIKNKKRTSGVEEKQIQQYHFISQISRSITRTYLSEETTRNRSLKAGAPVYLDALKWHFNQLHNKRNDSTYDSHPRNCLQDIEWYTKGLRRYFSHVSEIADYEENKAIEWELAKLFALGRLGNFYPLLLTVWDQYNGADGEERNLSDDEMLKILRTIEIGSFRIYAAANKRSDTGESRFYRLANRMSKGDPDADEIISNIEGAVDRYESDFSDALRDPNLYSTFSRRDVRYLLYSYDLYVCDQLDRDGMAIEKVVQNPERRYSIDHIWPRDTSQLGLDEEEEEIHDEIKHSLGNLTLTQGPRNASWKNLPYKKKRDRGDDNKDYMSSGFASTHKIAQDYDTWGSECIEERLDDIIQFAERRWSLDPDERERFVKLRP